MFNLPASGLLLSFGISFAVFFGPDLFATVMNGFPAFQAEKLSRVDPICKAKWVDTARNDMALKCYLQLDLHRLCDPEERAHLAWLVTEYDSHQKAYEDALLGYLVRTQINLGKATATEKDFGKAMTKAQREAAAPLAHDDFKKAILIETLRDKDVTALFQNAVKKGYLTRDDLNWSIPDAIEEAFAKGEGATTPKLHPCRADT